MPVYFAQAGEAGPVKIGFSLDVPRRLAEIQRDCPFDLILLRVVEGQRGTEAWFHGAFAESRIAGRREWFAFDERMISLLPGDEAVADDRRRQAVLAKRLAWLGPSAEAA